MHECTCQSRYASSIDIKNGIMDFYLSRESCDRIGEGRVSSQNRGESNSSQVFLGESPPPEWEVKVYSPVNDRRSPSTVSCSGQSYGERVVESEPASTLRDHTHSDDDDDKGRSKRRRLRESWDLTGRSQPVAAVSTEEIKEVEMCVEACLRDHVLDDPSTSNSCPMSDKFGGSDDNGGDINDDDDDDFLPSSCVMPRTVMKRSREDMDV